VRWCVVVMEQPFILSPNFEAKSSLILTQSPYNATILCGIHSLDCQDEMYGTIPLDCKGNDEHTFDISFHVSQFSVPISLDFPF
jgi:hypothetical protein